MGAFSPHVRSCLQDVWQLTSPLAVTESGHAADNGFITSHRLLCFEMPHLSSLCTKLTVSA